MTKQELYTMFKELEMKYAVLMNHVDENLDKYEKALWYQRSPAINMMEKVYGDTPKDIIEGAKKAAEQFERDYPEMVSKYREHPDFQHGWVSGVVASLRLMQGVLEAKEYEFEDEGEVFNVPLEEAVMDAVIQYPMLDS